MPQFGPESNHRPLRLDPETGLLMAYLAGPMADAYVSESLLPALSKTLKLPITSVEAARDALRQPYYGLKVLLGHYAFARRGRERSTFSDMATIALRRASSPSDFEQLLAAPDATMLWGAFTQVCEEWKEKPMEQLNRGAIAGLAELAQEIYRLDGRGSIVDWIVGSAQATHRLEPQFMRIVDIRGIGPKLSSLFIRDVAFLFDLEDRIAPVDRLYVQPIDKWLRATAPLVLPDMDSSQTADWILAGKVSKYARRTGVSGIRLNMGTSYFGYREARSPENIQSALERLRRRAMHSALR
jgi:hypothetical protein